MRDKTRTGMKVVMSIAVLILFSNTLMGQPRTIKGRLVSADNGTPIPGWNVMEPGTTNGTTTDMNGEFTLTVNSHPTIIWFPQCFTQLYVEYEENVDFKEVVLGTDVKGQIYKDSKKIERKLAMARPTRNIYGEVIDSKTKEPIDSCEVKIKGSETVVYSDDKGSFMINVPNNQVVELELKKDQTVYTVTYNANVDFKKIKIKPNQARR